MQGPLVRWHSGSAGFLGVHWLGLGLASGGFCKAHQWMSMARVFRLQLWAMVTLALTARGAAPMMRTPSVMAGQAPKAMQVAQVVFRGARVGNKVVVMAKVPRERGPRWVRPWWDRAIYRCLQPRWRRCLEKPCAFTRGRKATVVLEETRQARSHRVGENGFGSVTSVTVGTTGWTGISADCVAPHGNTREAKELREKALLEEAKGQLLRVMGSLAGLKGSREGKVVVKDRLVGRARLVTDMILRAEGGRASLGSRIGPLAMAGKIQVVRIAEARRNRVLWGRGRLWTGHGSSTTGLRQGGGAGMHWNRRCKNR